MRASISLLLFFSAPMVYADPPDPKAKLSDQAALAYTASVNLGAVSAMLTKNQKDVESMIAQRTDAIVARERTAAEQRSKVAYELGVYGATRSGGLADSLQAMMRAGEGAAELPGELDAMEAALRAEVKASTTLPAMSNAKIDEAAKKLAVLAEDPTPRQRAEQAAAFFKATREEVRKLEEKAKKVKDKADMAIASKDASEPPAAVAATTSAPTP